MKAINQLRKRRAVSPVIATVILVAVTITVAVAVAYWMSGIASQYTSFEKVEIQSAYASRKYDVATAPRVFQGWVIEIGVQNTGSSTSTLETLFINDKPLLEYGTYAGTTDKIRWADAPPGTVALWGDWDSVTTTIGISLESGDESKIYVMIYGDQTLIDPDATPDSGDEYTEGIFSAGTTINVKLHSANGMDYIRLVQLT